MRHEGVEARRADRRSPLIAIPPQTGVVYVSQRNPASSRSSDLGSLTLARPVGGRCRSMTGLLDPGDVFVSESRSAPGWVADSEMQQPDDAPTLPDVGLEQLEHFRVA